MVSFLLFVSCNQESLIENAEESQVNSLVSINCNDDIVENYINMAALSLIELIPQRSFVDEVHSEVAKMFDDDHDVLFKTLSSVLSHNSQNLNQLMSQSLDTVLSARYPQINSSSKFLNLPVSSIRTQTSQIITGIEVCENKLFLQIYIPNFETVDLTQRPIIAVGYDDNPEDCMTFGYQFVHDSIRIIDLDSSTAAKNLIWVVSLNNVVNNTGDLPESFFKLSDTSHVESLYDNSESLQTKSRTDVDKQVRIHSIWIHNKKVRCWLCGKDAVALVGYFSEYSWCKPVDSPKPINAGVLCKVGDKDLKKWITIPTDTWRAYIAHPTHSPLRKYNEAIEFVMYENSKRKKHAQIFSCDDTNCPNPLPTGMKATYYSRYAPYGQTTYLTGSTNRPLYYFDVLPTTGMQLINFPSYDWFGNRIRFHGSNVAL